MAVSVYVAFGFVSVVCYVLQDVFVCCGSLFVRCLLCVVGCCCLLAGVRGRLRFVVRCCSLLSVVCYVLVIVC